MANNIIIMKNDEQVTTAEYADYKDIQKAVGGMIECYEHIDFCKANGEKIHIICWCNEEYLLIDSEEMNRINAGAFLLNEEAVIYGDVAFLIDKGGGEERGFTPEETEEFVSFVKKILNDNSHLVHLIHSRFDGNKPEPRVEFFAFN